MQRLFIIGLAVCVTLAAALGVLLYVSLIPHFFEIGWAATGVLVLGLGCVSIMMLAFTYNQIGVWSAKRRMVQLHSRVIVAGNVVAYPCPDGTFVHLSAMHEAAKIPPPAPIVQALPAPQEPEPPATEETVMELFGKGMSLRDIAKATELTYYQVQKITSKKAEKS